MTRNPMFVFHIKSMEDIFMKCHRVKEIAKGWEKQKGQTGEEPSEDSWLWTQCDFQGPALQSVTIQTQIPANHWVKKRRLAKPAAE